MSVLIRVFDFETTGTEADEAFGICEIGWCDVVYDEGVEITVDPGGPHAHLCDCGINISVEARAVHHISDSEVLGKLGPEHYLQGALIEGNPDYYAAHKADFELALFTPPKPVICTYKVALRAYPDAPRHSNQVLRYLLNLPCAFDKAMPPHRAGPDAYVTAHLLAHMLEEGRASLKEMVHWSSGRALLPRMNFGKYRGQSWDAADDGYLEWIVNKSDMDEDVKANARYHLRKRAGARDAA